MAPRTEVNVMRQVILETVCMVRLTVMTVVGLKVLLEEKLEEEELLEGLARVGEGV
jgi:hypothetical protein